MVRFRRVLPAVASSALQAAARRWVGGWVDGCTAVVCECVGHGRSGDLPAC